MTGGGTIKTEKASAIAISGGDLTFADGVGTVYNVTSQNTRTDSATNSYNITLPVLKLNETTNKYELRATAYQNTDGIYLEGGSLACNGQLNLTHTGLQNKLTLTQYGSKKYQFYDDIQTNSYAVRVVGGSVTMLKGSITANIGGGVFCSQKEEEASSITMGDSTSESDSIIIRTLGTAYDNTEYEPTYKNDGVGWHMPFNKTGGETIELQGGNITVYNGTFTANYGNGVLAKGDGEITIKNGTFHGYHPNNNKFANKSGPASCYGLKVIGGATVIIENGAFDGGNGGAFITGVNSYEANQDLDNFVTGTQPPATVRVFAGTFGGSTTRDAFTVYDYADVVLGAYGTDYNGTAARKDLIKMTVNPVHDGASLAVCSFVGSGQRLDKLKTQVRIYYGTYQEEANGAIWNTDGFADITVYNARLNNNQVNQTVGISIRNNNGSWGRFNWASNNNNPIYFSE